MAVTVTDQRTILDQADAATNFNTGAQNSALYAEADYSIAYAYNITTGQIYYNGTCPNFTTTGNELIYVWSAIVATQNGYKEATPSNSSHAMWLSDGTNDLIIYMAGNDRDVFKHADGQVAFQCFLIDIDYLDTVNTNGDLAALAGSYASFSKTGISEVGSHYTTLSKALGGGVNCYIDIIRYGTGGISITGGTTGDRGTFAEICVEDRSTADQKAHGILREYTPGSYGCQGRLNFGTTSTGDSWFDDSGFVLTFEDRLVADDKFAIYVLGNTTGGEETHLYWANGTISSARPAVTVDMSSTGINTLDISGVSFVNLKNQIWFPTDSASYSHSVSGCSFSNCGQIDPGAVDFVNCAISDYDDTYDTNGGAVLIDSAADVDNWADLAFTSGGTGHAIKITATGTYNFYGFTYSGYGSAGTTDAAVYNDSGGAVTINVYGGNSPTVRNGTGASTTVNNPVTLTITGLIAGSKVYIYNDVSGQAGSIREYTDSSGTTFQHSYNHPGTDIPVIIAIGKLGEKIERIFYDMGDTDADLPVSQEVDRVYNNP